jgi:hypothetical protein
MSIREPKEKPAVQSRSAIAQSHSLLRSAMKKALHALAALMLGSLIAIYVLHVWQSTAYLRAQGREGTLVIEQQYVSSHWAEPLPLKKIHTYTAILAPEHHVVVESDQQLARGTEYPIHFLTRDKTRNAPLAPLRPISGALRLRLANDGSPVPADPAALFERIVNKAVGTFDKQPASPTPPPPVVKDASSNSVQFQLGKINEPLFSIIWRNSDATEWVALALATTLFLTLVANAWMLPWRAGQRQQNEDFVHPASRTA